MSCRRHKSPYFNKLKRDNRVVQPGNQTTLRFVSKPKWIPPRSPFKLIQESLFHDPWKLLIATIFLQRTGGERAVPLAVHFLDRWTTPEEVLQAPREELSDFLQPLGLNNRRARVIQTFTSKSSNQCFYSFNETKKSGRSLLHNLTTQP